MKVLSAAVLGLLPFLLPQIAVSGQTPSAASEISASGSALISLRPDHVVISATVQTRERTAAAASSENALVTTAVIAALRKAGLSAGDVTTADFTVEQYFPRPSDPREMPTPDGFTAHVVVRASTDNIDMAGNIIDAALSAGATRISLQYSSSKMMASRRGALDSAFQLARAEAAALAQAAGGSLGRLLSLMPNGPPPAVMYEVAAIRLSGVAGGMASPPPTLAPGNLTANVFVTGRWEFVPGVR